jgi:hypothetical protein
MKKTIIIFTLLMATQASAFNGKNFYEWSNKNASPYLQGAAFGYVRGFLEAAKAYDTRTIKTTEGWEASPSICYPDSETIKETVKKLRGVMKKGGTMELLEKNMATWMTSTLPYMYPCESF